jgi:hypothetical protein
MFKFLPFLVFTLSLMVISCGKDNKTAQPLYQQNPYQQQPFPQNGQQYQAQQGLYIPAGAQQIIQIGGQEFHIQMNQQSQMIINREQAKIQQQQVRPVMTQRGQGYNAQISGYLDPNQVTTMQYPNTTPRSFILTDMVVY